MGDVQIQRAGSQPRLRETLDPFERLMHWRDPFEAMGRWMSREEAGFNPQFELKEQSDAFVLSADLPGIDEDDLELELTADRITVSGSREEQHREEHDRYFTYERNYGSFSRSFTLPSDVNPDAVEASLADGVLTVRLPKRAEAKPRKIDLHKGKREAKHEKAKA